MYTKGSAFSWRQKELLFYLGFAWRSIQSSEMDWAKSGLRERRGEFSANFAHPPSSESPVGCKVLERILVLGHWKIKKWRCLLTPLRHGAVALKGSHMMGDG
jgi:hypothetical protein